jgi:hypothetical protein
MQGLILASAHALNWRFIGRRFAATLMLLKNNFISIAYLFDQVFLNFLLKFL